MHLARFPRRRYTPFWTPIEPLPNLSAALAGPEVWVKRDDMLGLASGGNKTRKLEFLVADALEQGADTLITVGAVQSNHCRLTLAAARREGLQCQLVLEERVPGSYREDGSGNNLLYRLMGAERIEVVQGGSDLNAAMQGLADELAAVGRKAYVIPGGGSNALGALGYAACAEELLAQAFDLGLRIDHLVVSSGSGGTHAGLLAGLRAAQADLPVTGVSVRAERGAQEARIHALADDTLALAGADVRVRPEDVVVDDAYVGPGYSLPSDEMVEAVQMFARLEGVLLDPVYTGKTAAGLIGLVRAGRFDASERVLLLHTGGSPALYAYQDVVLKELAG